MAGLAYAFHFDAGLYANYLRGYAEVKGVSRAEGVVEQIDRCSQTGDIRAITLDNGKQIEGDFFVDCTGFRALLMAQTLLVWSIRIGRSGFPVTGRSQCRVSVFLHCPHTPARPQNQPDGSGASRYSIARGNGPCVLQRVPFRRRSSPSAYRGNRGGSSCRSASYSVL